MPGEPPETELNPPAKSHLRELLIAGIPQEDTDDEQHDGMDLGMICSAANTLEDLEKSTTMCGCVSDEQMELGALTTKHVVSWSDICEASSAYAEIRELFNLVRNGFTTDARTLSQAMRPYFP